MLKDDFDFRYFEGLYLPRVMGRFALWPFWPPLYRKHAGQTKMGAAALFEEKECAADFSEVLGRAPRSTSRPSACTRRRRLAAYFLE